MLKTFLLLILGCILGCSDGKNNPKNDSGTSGNKNPDYKTFENSKKITSEEKVTYLPYLNNPTTISSEENLPYIPSVVYRTDLKEALEKIENENQLKKFQEAINFAKLVKVAKISKFYFIREIASKILINSVIKDGDIAIVETENLEKMSRLFVNLQILNPCYGFSSSSFPPPNDIIINEKIILNLCNTYTTKEKLWDDLIKLSLKKIIENIDYKINSTNCKNNEITIKKENKTLSYVRNKNPVDAYQELEKLSHENTLANFKKLAHEFIDKQKYEFLKLKNEEVIDLSTEIEKYINEIILAWEAGFLFVEYYNKLLKIEDNININNLSIDKLKKGIPFGYFFTHINLNNENKLVNDIMLSNNYKAASLQEKESILNIINEKINKKETEIKKQMPNFEIFEEYFKVVQKKNNPVPNMLNQNNNYMAECNKYINRIQKLENILNSKLEEINEEINNSKITYENINDLVKPLKERLNKELNAKKINFSHVNHEENPITVDYLINNKCFFDKYTKTIQGAKKEFHVKQYLENLNKIIQIYTVYEKWKKADNDFSKDFEDTKNLSNLLFVYSSIENNSSNQWFFNDYENLIKNCQNENLSSNKEFSTLCKITELVVTKNDEGLSYLEDKITYLKSKYDLTKKKKIQNRELEDYLCEIDYDYIIKNENYCQKLISKYGWAINKYDLSSIPCRNSIRYVFDNMSLDKIFNLKNDNLRDDHDDEILDDIKSTLIRLSKISKLDLKDIEGEIDGLYKKYKKINDNKKPIKEYVQKLGLTAEQKSDFEKKIKNKEGSPAQIYKEAYDASIKNINLHDSNLLGEVSSDKKNEFNQKVNNKLELLALPNLDEVCPICYENFNHDYVTLKCDHFFHINCINRWQMVEGKTCPMCRNSIAYKNIKIFFFIAIKDNFHKLPHFIQLMKLDEIWNMINFFSSQSTLNNYKTIEKMKEYIFENCGDFSPKKGAIAYQYEKSFKPENFMFAEKF